jgi:hypothetical protein
MYSARATRSDSLILDECWLPDSAAVLQSDECGRSAIPI